MLRKKRKLLTDRLKFLSPVNIFLIVLILDGLTVRKTIGLLLDSSISSSGSGVGGSPANSGSLPIGVGSGGGVGGGGAISFDKIGNLERSLAAVFNRVAYGSTTTKRSIPDNIFIPSITTVSTPLLTTYRYRDRDKEFNQEHQYEFNLNQEGGGGSSDDDNFGGNAGDNFRNRNYEIDLERDHALPTSAPNADILKTNSNPTYPNPNRHQHHDRDRHRHSQNSTPTPSGHNLKKNPTAPMFPGDMPSYSPPSRSFLTPPIPHEFQHPFADKPTLRGTNSDSTAINSGTFTNRRPIPPPSLMPGHERIPFRPPDLVGGGSSPTSGGVGGIAGNKQPQQSPSPLNPTSGISGSPPDIPSISLSNLDNQRKKLLNTPSHKNQNQKSTDVNDKMLGGGGGNLKSDNSSQSLGDGHLSVNNNGGAGLHFPSISRILSGSNGLKEDIPAVLLRTVTVRPSVQSPSQSNVFNEDEDGDDDDGGDVASSVDDDRTDDHSTINDNQGDDDDLDVGNDRSSIGGIVDVNLNNDNENFGGGYNFNNRNVEEPKTQPKIKSETEKPNDDSTSIHQHHHNNVLGDGFTTTQSLLDTNRRGGNSGHHQHTNGVPASSSSSTMATWGVAWNIHVYLSAILFTILAVYSIFKMIFYDKLTHLFNQSYFISIHLTLIIICLLRIFYLCYDAYNIHLSFNNFVSEILLNIPSTLLTVTFSILILFLLIKSLNSKNNRYSAVMRPLTIIVGCSVHICLCITLHYVENKQNQLVIYSGGGLKYRGGGGNLPSQLSPNNQNVNHPPPRVLSLICQIIYIFICLSLGLLYLYLYRILKRVLRNKSQNYIHGYQNLSYALHITIATALLFVLLAALQIYGAISISTVRRPLITAFNADIDWLQWGYQFSLRLIEIAIITLLSWVTGLKTGASKAIAREKDTDTHNVSGFALFPCTSSSSQEHFEADYPAVCNANTNLHTYTLRTGKPIYDDNFALNSLGGGPGGPINAANDINAAIQPSLPTSGGSDFGRPYETNSIRSSVQNQVAHHHHHHPHGQQQQQVNDIDYLNDSGTIPDHYENPNFELRSNNSSSHHHHHHHHHTPTTTPGVPNEIILDNCYSEPVNPIIGGPGQQPMSAHFDFQNFERPNFDRPSSRTEFRASKNLKALKSGNLERGMYENPERRSSNSTHSGGGLVNSGKPFNHNSFDRRGCGGLAGSGGVRKSGTLNNIGAMVSGRNGVVTSGQNLNQPLALMGSNGRASGVQTLSTSRSQEHQYLGGRVGNNGTNSNGGRSTSSSSSNNERKRDRGDRQLHQQSRSNMNLNGTGGSGYIIPDDDYSRNYENSSNSGGSDVGGSNGGGGRSYYASNIGERSHFNGGGNGTSGGIDSKQLMGSSALNSPGDGSGYDPLNENQQSSSGDSATSGSMLVAEHGFVRFRALDEIEMLQNHQRANNGGGGSGSGSQVATGTGRTNAGTLIALIGGPVSSASSLSTHQANPAQQINSGVGGGGNKEKRLVAHNT